MTVEQDKSLSTGKEPQIEVVQGIEALPVDDSKPVGRDSTIPTWMYGEPDPLEVFSDGTASQVTKIAPVEKRV